MLCDIGSVDDVDSDNEVLIGSMRGEIVGIQYYKGTVSIIHLTRVSLHFVVSSSVDNA